MTATVTTDDQSSVGRSLTFAINVLNQVLRAKTGLEFGISIIAVRRPDEPTDGKNLESYFATSMCRCHGVQLTHDVTQTLVDAMELAQQETHTMQ